MKTKEPAKIEKLAMNVMLKLNELDSSDKLLWSLEMSDNEIKFIKKESKSPVLFLIKT